MKRIVETIKRREVYICDRCDQQVDLLRDCKICSREVGPCCGEVFFLRTQPGGVIDETPILVCEDCCQADKNGSGESFQQSLTYAAQNAERDFNQIISNWIAWVHQSRKTQS